MAGLGAAGGQHYQVYAQYVTDPDGFVRLRVMETVSNGGSSTNRVVDERTAAEERERRSRVRSQINATLNATAGLVHGSNHNRTDES